MKKIILINILIFIFLLIVADVFFYFQQMKIEKSTRLYNFFNIPQKFSIDTVPYDEGKEYKTSFPIIISGCSFAYSWGLSGEDTFAYKLAKKLKRHVFVCAVPGCGPNEALWIYNNDKMYKSVWGGGKRT